MRDEELEQVLAAYDRHVEAAIRRGSPKRYPEIERVLRDQEHWDDADDDIIEEVAAHWGDWGFGPEEVADWHSVGIWAADVAAWLRDHGIRPDEVWTHARHLLQEACRGAVALEEMANAIAGKKRKQGGS